MAISADVLSIKAREIGEKNIAFFGRWYFPHYIRGPVPNFHKEILTFLQDEADNGIVYWPREHSKTTWVSLIYPIWNQAYKKRRFQMLLSETDKQVMRILRNIRRAVTNTNGRYTRLIADFGPELALESHNAHELIFATRGQIAGSSHGSSDRGASDEEQRPDLVIGDDIENIKTVATADQRDQTQEWWESEIIPMMDSERGRALWVGTMLHEDAAMAREASSGGYHVIRKSAVISEPANTALWNEAARVWDEARSKAPANARADDEKAAEKAAKTGVAAARKFYLAHQSEMDAGAEVLWEAKHPYFALWAKRRLLGSTRFSLEYQNEPVAAENLIVQPTQIINFRIESVIEAASPVTYLLGDDGQMVKLSELQFYMAIDPAISQKSTADYFALSVLGAHSNGSRWLLDLVHDRLSFEQQIQTILRTYVAWRSKVGDRIIAVGVESVMYQKALKQALDSAALAAGLSIPTREILPINDKVLRLTRQQPLFEQGLVHVQKDKHGVVVDEVCGFTRDGKIMPTHDDAMDALIYALALAEEKGLAEAYDFFTFAG